MPIPEELKKRIEANIEHAEKSEALARDIITFAAKADIDVSAQARELDNAIARIARIKAALKGE